MIAKTESISGPASHLHPFYRLNDEHVKISRSDALLPTSIKTRRRKEEQLGRLPRRPAKPAAAGESGIGQTIHHRIKPRKVMSGFLMAVLPRSISAIRDEPGC
jgi:hypothetical protein